MSTIITKKQFNNHIYKTEIAGRPFSLEVGKVASWPTPPPWSATATPPCWWRSPPPPGPGRHGLLPPERGL